MRILTSFVVTTALLGCDGKAITASTADAGIGVATGGSAGASSDEDSGTPNAGSTSAAAGASSAGASSAGSGSDEPDEMYVDPVFDAGPDAIADSGSVTFTVHNNTSVPLALPGGIAGRWLEIGYSGYSLWPANSVMDGTLCDADPTELGELPPPGAEIPPGGEFTFEWKANAFRGAQPVPGMSEDYFCARTGSVPLGDHQFLICARESDVLCHAQGTMDFPPRLICAPTTAHVALGHTSAEFSFDDSDFPTENCPSAEEIPKPE